VSVKWQLSAGMVDQNVFPPSVFKHCSDAILQCSPEGNFIRAAAYESLEIARLYLN